MQRRQHLQYTIAPTVTRDSTNVYRHAEFTITSITQEAQRLRSWALISGERITGLPFVRVSAGLGCTVHVPVDGRVSPHPETGVSLERAAGGKAVALRVVQFDEARPLVREMTGEIAVDCGLAGPAEFHPSSAEFRTGTLIWPVHKFAPAMHDVVALPGDVLRAAV